MSRNSCFPTKELLSSIFFKIVSRDKNINAIRENSEISERIETPQHLSKSPRKLFEGLSTNALHFPDDQTSYFSISNIPQIYPLLVDTAEYSNRQRSSNGERDPSLASES